MGFGVFDSNEGALSSELDGASLVRVVVTIAFEKGICDSADRGKPEPVVIYFLIKPHGKPSPCGNFSVPRNFLKIQQEQISKFIQMMVN